MATRSLICIYKNNHIRGISEGDIIGVYCHYDGYPSHNGKILKEHYNTIEKVEELISFGSMSYLENDVSSTKFYYLEERQPEKNKTPFSVGFWSAVSNRPFFEEKEEYNYIFKDGKWLCYTYSGKEIDLY